MRTHAIALAATVAALTTSAAPAASAQSWGLDSLFSCRGNTGTAGTIVGGLAGAALGSQVSKNERTLGAVVGAGLGAWAGNQIACRMNTSGRERAETAFQRALDTGRPQNWHDPQTGASGRIDVLSRGYADNRAPYAGAYGSQAAATDLRFAGGVERVYNLGPTAPLYRTDRRINLRAAPSASARIVDRLQPGETIRPAGLTRNGWIAVEEAGLVRGYVSAGVVRPAGELTYAAGADCRLVEQTISMRGYRTETQRFNACRDSDGQWRMTPA
jgi:surface antigen